MEASAKASLSFMSRVAACAFALVVVPVLAAPAIPGCPWPGALGTSRTIAIDPAAGPVHVGLKTYSRTLDLADHEVVLTFDDGPSPSTTPRVLAALRGQCVRRHSSWSDATPPPRPGWQARDRRRADGRP